MSDDALTIDYYWRPGCPFCMNLERNLEQWNLPLNKMNIWDDPEHAAKVRSVADGNETVPTGVIGSVAMVNPSPGQVLEALQTEAPELIPDGVEAPAPGKLSRGINKLLGGE